MDGPARPAGRAGRRAVRTGPRSGITGRTAPGWAVDFIVAVTVAPGLRGLLWWLFLSGTVVSVAVWFLRRTVQSSADRVGTVLAPYVGGGVITLAVVAVAGPAVDAIETALRATPAAAAVEQFFVPILDVYGPETVTLALAVVALFSLISVAGQLSVALATNHCETDGRVTLAAAGLFGASAFAATLSTPTWLVLAAWRCRCRLGRRVLRDDAGTRGRERGRDAPIRTRPHRRDRRGGRRRRGGDGGAVRCRPWLYCCRAIGRRSRPRGLSRRRAGTGGRVR